MSDYTVPSSVRKCAQRTLTKQIKSPLEGVAGIATAKDLVSGDVSLDRLSSLHRFFTTNESRYVAEKQLMYTDEVGVITRSYMLHGGEAGQRWVRKEFNKAVAEGLIEKDPILELFNLDAEGVYSRFQAGAWRYEYDLTPSKAARFVEEYTRATGIMLELPRAFGEAAVTVGNAVYRRMSTPSPLDTIQKALKVPELKEVAEEELAVLDGCDAYRMLNEAMKKNVFSTLPDLVTAKLLFPPMVAYLWLAVEAPEKLVDLHKQSKKPPKIFHKPKVYTQYHDTLNTFNAFFNINGGRFADADGTEWEDVDEELYLLMNRAWFGKRIVKAITRKTLIKAHEFLKSEKKSAPLFKLAVNYWTTNNRKKLLELIPVEHDVYGLFSEFVGSEDNLIPADVTTAAGADTGVEEPTPPAGSPAVDPEPKAVPEPEDTGVSLADDPTGEVTRTGDLEDGAEESSGQTLAEFIKEEYGDLSAFNYVKVPTTKAAHEFAALYSDFDFNEGSMVVNVSTEDYFEALKAFKTNKEVKTEDEDEGTTTYAAGTVFVFLKDEDGDILPITDDSLSHLVSVGKVKPVTAEDLEDIAELNDAEFSEDVTSAIETWMKNTDKSGEWEQVDTIQSPLYPSMVDKGMGAKIGEQWTIPNEGSSTGSSAPIIYTYKGVFSLDDGAQYSVFERKDGDNITIKFGPAQSIAGKIKEEHFIALSKHRQMQADKDAKVEPIHAKTDYLMDASGDVFLVVKAPDDENPYYYLCALALKEDVGSGTSLVDVAVGNNMKKTGHANILDAAQYIMKNSAGLTHDDSYSYTEAGKTFKMSDAIDVDGSTYSIVSFAEATDGVEHLILMGFAKQNGVDTFEFTSVPVPSLVTGVVSSYDPPTAEEVETQTIEHYAHTQMCGTQEAVDWITRASKSKKPTVYDYATIEEAFESFGPKLHTLGSVVGHVNGKWSVTIVGYFWLKKGTNQKGFLAYVTKSKTGKLNWKTAHKAKDDYPHYQNIDSGVANNLVPSPTVTADTHYTLNYKPTAAAIAWEQAFEGHEFINAPKDAKFSVGTKVKAKQQETVYTLGGWAMVDDTITSLLFDGEGGVSYTQTLENTYEQYYEHGTQLIPEGGVSFGKKDSGQAAVSASNPHVTIPSDVGDYQDVAVEQPAFGHLPKGKHISAGIAAVLAAGTTMSVQPTGKEAKSYTSDLPLLVMIRPANNFNGYSLTFPKGTVDKGEGVSHAAHREFEEETGLKAQAVEWLGDYEGKQSITRHFLGKVIGGNPANADKETDAVVFLPLDINEAAYMSTKWFKELDGRDKNVVHDVVDALTKAQDVPDNMSGWEVADDIQVYAKSDSLSLPESDKQAVELVGNPFVVYKTPEEAGFLFTGEYTPKLKSEISYHELQAATNGASGYYVSPVSVKFFKHAPIGTKFQFTDANAMGDLEYIVCGYMIDYREDTESVVLYVALWSVSTNEALLTLVYAQSGAKPDGMTSPAFKGKWWKELPHEDKSPETPNNAGAQKFELSPYDESANFYSDFPFATSKNAPSMGVLQHTFEIKEFVAGTLGEKWAFMSPKAMSSMGYPTTSVLVKYATGGDTRYTVEAIIAYPNPTSGKNDYKIAYVVQDTEDEKYDLIMVGEYHPNDDKLEWVVKPTAFQLTTPKYLSHLEYNPSFAVQGDLSTEDLEQASIKLGYDITKVHDEITMPVFDSAEFIVESFATSKGYPAVGTVTQVTTGTPTPVQVIGYFLSDTVGVEIVHMLTKNTNGYTGYYDIQGYNKTLKKWTEETYGPDDFKVSEAAAFSTMAAPTPKDPEPEEKKPSQNYYGFWGTLAATLNTPIDNKTIKVLQKYVDEEDLGMPPTKVTAKDKVTLKDGELVLGGDYVRGTDPETKFVFLSVLEWAVDGKQTQSITILRIEDLVPSKSNNYAYVATATSVFKALYSKSAATNPIKPLFTLDGTQAPYYAQNAVAVMGETLQYNSSVKVSEFKKWCKQAGVPLTSYIDKAMAPYVARLFLPNIPKAYQSKVLNGLKARKKAKDAQKHYSPTDVTGAMPKTTTATVFAPVAKQVSYAIDSGHFAQTIHTLKGEDFTDTGKGVSGGSKPNKVLKTSDGLQWFYKTGLSDNDKYRAYIDAAAYDLVQSVKGNNIPVTTIELNGVLGSVQPYDSEAEAAPSDPTELSTTDAAEVLAQHMFDMFVGDHDGHAGNWIRTKGKLRRIDLGQAFKFIFQKKTESFDPTWSPEGNFGTGYAKKILTEWSKGAIEITPASFVAMKSAINNVQKITDDKLSTALAPVFKGKGSDSAEQSRILKALKKRRDSYLKDWTTVLQKLRPDFEWPKSGLTKMGEFFSNPDEAGFGPEQHLDVEKARDLPEWLGRSMRVDKGFIEGQQVLVQQVTSVLTGAETKATLIRFRLNNEGGVRMAKHINPLVLDVQENDDEVGTGLQVLLADKFWLAIRDAIANLNYHLSDNKDLNINAMKIDNALAQEAGLQDLQNKAVGKEGVDSAGDPWTEKAAMASLYLTYINIIKGINSDLDSHLGSKSETFNQYKYDASAYDAAKKVAQRRAAAKQATKAESLKQQTQGLTIKKVNTGGKLPELQGYSSSVVSSQVSAGKIEKPQQGALLLTGLNKAHFGSDQTQYIITDKGTGAKLYINPTPVGKDGKVNARAYRGQCWGYIPEPLSPSSVAHLLKMVEVVTGVNTKPSTPNDAKIAFLAANLNTMQGSTKGVFTPTTDAHSVNDPILESGLAAYYAGDDKKALQLLRNGVAAKMGIDAEDVDKLSSEGTHTRDDEDGGWERPLRIGTSRADVIKIIGKGVYPAHGIMQQSMVEFFEAIGANGLLAANAEKSFVAAPISGNTGASVSADIASGGSVGAFGCFRKIKSTGILYFDPSLLLRLDVYMIGSGGATSLSDGFGNWNYTHVKSLEGMAEWIKANNLNGTIGASSAGQIIYNRGVKITQYLHTCKVGNESQRKQLIMLCEDRGWNKFAQGRTPEQVFIT